MTWKKTVGDPRADCNLSVRGDAKYRYYIITGAYSNNNNNNNNTSFRRRRTDSAPREDRAQNDTDDKSNLYITRVEARAKRTHNIK